MTKPGGAFSAKSRPENVTAVRVTERNLDQVLEWVVSLEHHAEPIGRAVQPGDFMVYSPMRATARAMTLEEFYSEYHIA